MNKNNNHNQEKDYQHIESYLKSVGSSLPEFRVTANDVLRKGESRGTRPLRQSSTSIFSRLFSPIGKTVFASAFCLVLLLGGFLLLKPQGGDEKVTEEAGTLSLAQDSLFMKESSPIISLSGDASPVSDELRVADQEDTGPLEAVLDEILLDSIEELDDAYLFYDMYQEGMEHEILNEDRFDITITY